MIDVRDLHKLFGSRAALSGASFQAADGAITGLLGPNGAGKSTTLRIISTVLAPTRGNVLIDGRDVEREPHAARAALGVLPASCGLYRELTARENVQYFGALHGLSGARLTARIDALFAQLELEDCAALRGKALSQGQRVKVALARALVHEPHNVLLDEPTNGLDILAVKTLRRLLEGLRDAGHCVLFSSHVLAEVAALSDRIVIIGRGRVAAAGTPAELAGGRGLSLEAAYLAALGEAIG